MHYNRDMLKIAQMDQGEKMYHYTTNDALINIVTNRELWITQWDYLNDMDELRVAEEVCETILREEGVDSKVIEAIKKKIDENRYEIGPYFILSFSRDKDSQLLWSNYANLDGLNLEIDFAKFKKNLNDRIKWHGLVNYDLESQKKCMRESFCDELINIEDIEDFGKIKSLNDINKLTGKEYEMLIVHISVICMVYSMFFKREYFKGENEYRFVLSYVDENEIKINFRSRNGLIIPYIKEKVEELAFINNITIGPTNKTDMATSGVRELLHHNDLEIDVTKSKIPLRF